MTAKSIYNQVGVRKNIWINGLSFGKNLCGSIGERKRHEQKTETCSDQNYHIDCPGDWTTVCSV